MSNPPLPFTSPANSHPSDIDALATFETAGALVVSMQAPTRYAVRQVLDQELQRTITQRENAARQARLRQGGAIDPSYVFNDKDNTNRKKNKPDISGAGNVNVKRDFFGRIIVETTAPLSETDGNGSGKRQRGGKDDKGQRVWVTYHEGLNNAVTKPITLEEFLRGF